MEYRSWGKAALVRAVKTFAQAGVAFIGTAAVSAAGLAAVLSLLTSVAGLPEVDE